MGRLRRRDDVRPAAQRHPDGGGVMSEPVLRDYQLDLVEKARQAFAARTRRVLLQAPTGSGKTVMFAHIAHRAAQRNKRVLILVHRIELVRQTVAKLAEYGVAPDLI